ncbi:helix-turn-helix domain-containing protein [Hymenobacter sp. YC55]|uniref:winged helix-turn-helix transcriptional regulator n=1 Tax=Hymenobacter sp. YC55 TaxID=3034019 RepID=UPI0023F8E1E2|nr:helix-turn-helix domain-containing protein [Hymenobacter sp. YC55]MDF7814118.1 helix-turn-helix domain-containing protein [Hymenobacter sp. YC55]
MMESRPYASRECRDAYRAVRDTLDVVSGKWKLVILAVLLEEKQRFKELSRKIGISPRILSKELQELELNKLVTRTVCDTRPVTVEYAATEHAQTLGDVIHAMHQWGQLHHATIVGQPRPKTSELERALEK